MKDTVTADSRNMTKTKRFDQKYLKILKGVHVL